MEATNQWNLDRIDSQYGLDGFFNSAETGINIDAYVLDTGINKSKIILLQQQKNLTRRFIKITPHLLRVRMELVPRAWKVAKTLWTTPQPVWIATRTVRTWLLRSLDFNTE